MDVYRCDKHDKDVEIICLQCHKSVCLNCFVAEHNTHKVILASEKIEKNKKIISDSIRAINKKLIESETEREKLMKGYQDNAKSVFQEIKVKVEKELDSFHEYLIAQFDPNDFDGLKKKLEKHQVQIKDLKYLTNNEAVEEILPPTKNLTLSINEIDTWNLQQTLTNFQQALRKSVRKISAEKNPTAEMDKIVCDRVITCFTISNDKLYICCGKELLIREIANSKISSSIETWPELEESCDVLVNEEKIYYFIGSASNSYYAPTTGIKNWPNQRCFNNATTARVKNLIFIRIENIDSFSLTPFKAIIFSRGDTIYEMDGNMKKSEIKPDLSNRCLSQLQYVIKLRNGNFVFATSEGIHLYKGEKTIIDGHWQTIYSEDDLSSPKTVTCLTSDSHDNIYAGIAVVERLALYRNNSSNAYFQTHMYGQPRTVAMGWNNNVYPAARSLQTDEMINVGTHMYGQPDAKGRNENVYPAARSLQTDEMTNVIIIFDKYLNALFKIQTEFQPKKIQISQDDKLYVSYKDQKIISVYKLNFTEDECKLK